MLQAAEQSQKLPNNNHTCFTKQCQLVASAAKSVASTVMHAVSGSHDSFTNQHVSLDGKCRQSKLQMKRCSQNNANSSTSVAYKFTHDRLLLSLSGHDKLVQTLTS